MSHEPTISQNFDDRLRAQQRSSQKLRPPTDVPGYEFERFLGSGAYGEVWVAVDRNTGRRTAVKFYVHRGGIDWSLLSREVEKLAFLFADRYVVQLIDVGWDANPPYFTMEYLENGSLADRVQTGPIPPTEAVSLFRDITIGLIHAHDKGVLHCDLKPANVLLDQDLRPRLADFGQSRLSHEQSPALGTLFYMAPEQADLKAVPDARWDVYALGALLYCMLTGEPPHRSPETLTLFDRAHDLGDKLAAYRRHLESVAVPTKHRDVPGVDRDLADIVTKCLQPNPTRRFPNPQAVLDALDMRTLRQRRRPLLVLGAIGPAVLLAVLSWFAWSVYRTSVRESDEALATKTLRTNDYAAQFVAGAVAGQINRRWISLEQQADDPDIRARLARVTASGSMPSDEEQQFLQSWLAKAGQRHSDLEAASWTMMDGRGTQIARVPAEKKTLGRNYSFRDYFNGRGELPEGTKDVEPIRAAHLSNVFVSDSTGDRKVAFSVPVWENGDAGSSARKVVGVLSITVALGQFAELHADDENGSSLIAALADTKPDEDRRPGVMLEHPYLAELERTRKDATPLKAYYFEGQALERMQTLAKSPEKKQLKASTDDDYHDPIGGDFSGRWLAAMEPVVVAGRSSESANTGWIVVVQERYEAALRPAQQLGEKLLRYGLTALGIVLAVVTALWGFVVIVLNESPRWKFVATLRQTVGLGSGSIGGQTGVGSNRSERDDATPRGPSAQTSSTQPTLTFARPKHDD